MTPTFGQTIRAARLGYRWLAGLQMFVRVCIIDAERFAVYVAASVNGRVTEPKEHACWWEGGDFAGKIIAKALHGKPSGCYVLDNEGRLMSWPTKSSSSATATQSASPAKWKRRASPRPRCSPG